ncbi:MAG: phosphatidate cytidylyltransferase [Candidatus Latescibacterota bacterium]|nr:MAG: phosphatidate cytidylyltransferase [Candidatus Latescibacterota bacterium]
MASRGDPALREDVGEGLPLERELQRKLIHISSLLIPLGLWLVPRGLALTILGGVTALFLVADVLRFFPTPFQGFFYRSFGPLLRSHESKDITASTYLLLASFLCAWWFGSKVAILATLYLILGDSSAALAGRHIGRTRIYGRKTLEGSLAGLSVNLAIALCLPLLPSKAELVGAVVAVLAELIPGVDDNFVIPLAAGGVMYLLA